MNKEQMIKQLKAFCYFSLMPNKLREKKIVLFAKDFRALSSYKCTMCFEERDFRLIDKDNEDFPEYFTIEYHTDKGYFYWRMTFYQDDLLVELEDGSNFPLTHVLYEEIEKEKIEDIFIEAYQSRDKLK